MITKTRLAQFIKREYQDPAPFTVRRSHSIPTHITVHEKCIQGVYSNRMADLLKLGKKTSVMKEMLPLVL